MRVAVPAETKDNETRVAATPDTVKRLIGLGAEIVIQKDAGKNSGVSDAEYEAAGATIAADAGETVRDADIVLQVRRPDAPALDGVKPGALVLAVMDPHGNEAALKSLADANVSTFAMELMTRITRAQSMDVLSSQANLAGYRAVIDAVAEYGRRLPW